MNRNHESHGGYPGKVRDNSINTYLRVSKINITTWYTLPFRAECSVFNNIHVRQKYNAYRDNSDVRENETTQERRKYPSRGSKS